MSDPKESAISTSQNGFAALSSSSPLLHTWIVPGTDTKLRLRGGSAGFLLIHNAMFFDDRVEDIDDNYRNGELDDWGYAYRPVRGYTTTLSNHSSGTACDLNATDHPLGVSGTFTAAQIATVRKRLKMYDGCIRWGGDYQNGRPDSMHFEIDKPMADCERVARRLINTPRGRRILAANPGQKKVILS